MRTGDIGNFGQTFIVNPEQIISTYGQQLTVLFKETLEDVEDTAIPGNTEMIIVLLNREALFERIPANGDIDTIMLDGEEVAKIIKAGQNKCAVTIMRYLRQLFSHKGIRADRDKTLYQRVPETPMLYKPIHIPSAPGKSPIEKLLTWLNKEINRYAPRLVSGRYGSTPTAPARRISSTTLRPSWASRSRTSRQKSAIPFRTVFSSCLDMPPPCSSTCISRTGPPCSVRGVSQCSL